MFDVQKYLLSNSIEKLTEEFGINIAKHPSDPLVILNYDQINSSPKSHPIVRDCRGLTLNSNDWSLVSRSFRRFFNYGEFPDDKFNFNDFSILSKEDGSLCNIYYWNGWRMNTRGSFGLDLMQNQQFTWQEGFMKALGVDYADLDKYLDRNLSYACEFCSPWNKVVRYYPQPVMYLLSAFDGHNELKFDDIKTPEIMRRPVNYRLNNYEEIASFLVDNGREDPTFEGVVIRDNNDVRTKIKSETYVALHHLRGEGDNMFNMKYQLKFLLKNNEVDELKAYFPEITESIDALKARLDNYWAELVGVMKETANIENQKDFAFAIKGKTPFIGLLFSMRKMKTYDEQSLYKAWIDNEQHTLKVLKGEA